MPADLSLLSLAGEAAAFCLKAGLSGPLGRLSDEIIRDRMEEVRDRLSNLEQPKKRDLHLGVYRSMVQATLCTCLDELREMGVPDEKTFSFFSDRERKLTIAKRARGHEHVAWFEEVRQWCYAELQALRDPDEGTTEDLESTPINADPLLGFGEEDAAQTLRAALSQEVISRLETAIERSRSDAAGEIFEDRWPDRFTAFIREQYKEDDRFYRVLNRTLLSGISAGQDQLSELFSDEVSTWGNAIRERIDQVLRAIRRRPLYEKYRGASTEDALHARLEDLKGRFGGREQELTKIDRFINEGGTEGRNGGLFVITGPMGSGKSALLAQWVRRQQEEFEGEGSGPTGKDDEGGTPFIALHMFSRLYSSLTSPLGAYQNLLAQLYTYFEVEDRTLPSTETDAEDAIHGLLSDDAFKARADEPLVIVIDALDEADPPREGQHMSLPIPQRRWPEHVYVLVSARASPDRVPSYLDNWLRQDEATRFELAPRLPREAVRQLLADSPQQAVKGLAEDDSFVRRLHESTEKGYPLYLSYVIDDLEKRADEPGRIEQDEDLSAVLDSIPDQFSEYVIDRLQLDRLSDRLHGDDRAAMLLDLLAAAEGPLSTQDLLNDALTGYVSNQQLRGLPWEVTRWLLIRPGEGGEGNLYAFAHPKIAAIYRDQSIDRVGDAREKLAAYCMQWEENRSPYALRYAAHHLRQTGSLDALYELLRDETYRERQVEQFGQYDATYRALREGMEAYIEQNGATPEDDARLCRLALDAGKVAQEAKEDVTEAFRWAEAGRMEDALRRIEVLGEKKYFLAALRLLWIEADRQAERPETERTAEVAQDILSAVEKRIAPGTKAIDWSEFWSTDFMAWWTAHLSAVMPGLDVSSMLTRTSELKEIMEGLAKRIVEEDEGETIGSLSRISLGVAREIGDDQKRVDALIDFAEALAETGATDRARSVFEEALAAARKIADGWGSMTAILRDDFHLRAEALSEVVGALAMTGATDRARSVFEEALAAAQEIVFDQGRAEALSRVAGAIAEMESTDRALPALEGIQAAAQEIGDDPLRAVPLSGVAQAFAETGATDRARSTADEALTAAREIDENRLRAQAFSEAARSLGGGCHRPRPIRL